MITYKNDLLEFERNRDFESALPFRCEAYNYTHEKRVHYIIIYNMESNVYQLDRMFDGVEYRYSKQFGWVSMYLRHIIDFDLTDWNYAVNVILMDIL